jgi:hypothetical protein
VSKKIYGILIIISAILCLTACQISGQEKEQQVNTESSQEIGTSSEQNTDNTDETVSDTSESQVCLSTEGQTTDMSTHQQTTDVNTEQAPTTTDADIVKTTENEKVSSAPYEDSTDFIFYFQDNNQPWSEYPHGSSVMRSSGCGTTSLAMVLATLTGDSDKYTPGTIAQYEREHNISTPNQDVDSIPLLCKELDTGCEAEYYSGSLDLDLVDATLEKGGYIILDAIADTGDESARVFANYNHYIVIRGGNQTDGYYIANSLYRFSADNSSYRYAPQNERCIPAKEFHSSYYYTIQKSE